MARKHCWSLSSCLLDSANRRGRSGTEIRTNVWNKVCSSIPTCSVSSGLNALLQSCLQEVPCIALIRSFRTLIPDIHSWLPLLKLYANRSFKGLAQADPPPLSADGLSLDTNSAWERRHSAEIDSKMSVEWKACKERDWEDSKTILHGCRITRDLPLLLTPSWCSNRVCGCGLVSRVWLRVAVSISCEWVKWTMHRWM